MVKKVVADLYIARGWVKLSVMVGMVGRTMFVLKVMLFMPNPSIIRHGLRL